jgi:GntR family transcriptional regulator
MELANQIRNKISKGDFASGERLPSEPKLCTDTGYSRSTVRKALQLLVDEGYICKFRGKGSFVSANAQQMIAQRKLQDTFETHKLLETNRVHFVGFTENAELMGVCPTTRTVSFRLVAPTANMRDFFGIGPDNMLVEITRLRNINEEPALVETTWLAPRYRDIDRNKLDGSLYAQLKDQYDVSPVKGSKTISIVYANESESFLLGVKKGSPLMLVEDRAFDDDGNPLHISKQTVRGDKFSYGIKDAPDANVQIIQ